MLCSLKDVIGRNATPLSALPRRTLLQLLLCRFQFFAEGCYLEVLLFHLGAHAFELYAMLGTYGDELLVRQLHALTMPLVHR